MAAGLATHSNVNAANPDAPASDPDSTELERYKSLVGETFRLHSETTGAIKAKLVKAEGLKPTGKVYRQPFSLLFRVIASEPVSQDMFQVSHQQIGTLPLLLVPITPPAQSQLLEAVFA